jgi:hypothetical protein
VISYTFRDEEKAILKKRTKRSILIEGSDSFTKKIKEPKIERLSIQFGSNWFLILKNMLTVLHISMPETTESSNRICSV